MAGHDGKLKLLAVSGSVRTGSWTTHVLDLVVGHVRALPEEPFNVQVLDLKELTMPFPGMPGAKEASEQLQSIVKEFDAVLFATPEYQGSYSAILKLFIEHLGYPSVLEGKPVALVGVAGGSIGAVKSLEHLRGLLSHVGAHVLPFALSVGGAYGAFDEDGKPRHPKLEAALAQQAQNFAIFVQKFTK